MITDYKIFENIENNGFTICFYLSKISKDFFTLKYTITFKTKAVNRTSIKTYLNKLISDELIKTIFFNKPLYKKSIDIYLFNRKEIAYAIFNLLTINFPKSRPYHMVSHTKQKLDYVINSIDKGLDSNCFLFIKEYNNNYELNNDFKNIDNDIDAYAEKMLELNDRFFLNEIFKLLLNDKLKIKYDYFNHAKNFDLLW